MLRATIAVFGLAVLCGCQASQTPPTTAERCSDIDMQIATTQENDTLEQDAKLELLDNLVQEKAELNCP